MSGISACKTDALAALKVDFEITRWFMKLQPILVLAACLCRDKLSQDPLPPPPPPPLHILHLPL